jgi:AbrB family looped-hinge helix DNA binding protein
MVIDHYHGMISETATVTSKSMVNIPAKIRKKYSIKEGTKIVFIENEEGRLEMIPVPPLSELFGADREHKDALLADVRELEKEHRSEALLDKKKLGH